MYIYDLNLCEKNIFERNKLIILLNYFVCHCYSKLSFIKFYIYIYIRKALIGHGTIIIVIRVGAAITLAISIPFLLPLFLIDCEPVMCNYVTATR